VEIHLREILQLNEFLILFGKSILRLLKLIICIEIYFHQGVLNPGISGYCPIKRLLLTSFAWISCPVSIPGHEYLPAGASRLWEQGYGRVGFGCIELPDEPAEPISHPLVWG
jgi:hypothetical protein